MNKQVAQEREDLKWLIEVAENRQLDTDEKRWVFTRECIDFITRCGRPTLAVPGKHTPLEFKQATLQELIDGLPRDNRCWTERLQGRIRWMLAKALQRTQIDLEWQEWRSLHWDTKRERFCEGISRGRDNIESATLRCFANLLLRYGHWITTCKAPEPHKRGRKVKGASHRDLLTATLFFWHRGTPALIAQPSVAIGCSSEVGEKRQREKSLGSEINFPARACLYYKTASWCQANAIA